MNNLVKQALQAKKPTKADAFNTLLEVLANADVEADSINVPTEHLISLAAFFKPAKTKAIKSAFQWAAQFADPKELRPALKHVMVQDGKGYGTNGHVLATFETDLPDGIYCPNTGIRVGDLEDIHTNMIVSIHRVTDLHKPVGDSFDAVIDEVDKMSTGGPRTASQPVWLSGLNQAIDMKYAQAVLKAGDCKVSATAESSLVFDTPHGQAVVMGVRTASRPSLSEKAA